LARLSIGTPTDNRDLVVDHREEFPLGVNTTSVLFELVGDLDTAGDGSVLGKIRLHLGGTREAVVVGSIVLPIVNGPAFVLAGFVGGAWRPGAVLALVNSTTSRGAGVVGDVLLARRVRNTFAVGEFVNTTRVATLARATSSAVDNDLGVEANRRGVVILKEDVESIGEGGGGSLSPA
jgi:hypothetical protein